MTDFTSSQAFICQGVGNRIKMSLLEQHTLGLQQFGHVPKARVGFPTAAFFTVAHDSLILCHFAATTSRLVPPYLKRTDIVYKREWEDFRAISDRRRSLYSGSQKGPEWHFSTNRPGRAE